MSEPRSIVPRATMGLAFALLLASGLLTPVAADDPPATPVDLDVTVVEEDASQVSNDFSATEQFSLTSLQILANEDVPIGVDDYYVTGGNLNAVPPGVMWNDTLPSTGNWIPTYLAGPTFGSSVSVDPDGGFHYRSGGYVGPDEFTYWYVESESGETSDPVLVQIRVGDNFVPVANDDAYTLPAGATFTISAPDGALSNDSDPDGDPLVATLVDSPPPFPSFTFDFDGSLSGMTPNVAEDTTYSFLYMASDTPGSFAQALISITVQAAGLPTDTATSSPTNTPTSSPTTTATQTPTPTPSNTPTPTSSPTNSPTSTATNTPTDSPTNTATNTATTPTNSPTVTPTNTATNTPTSPPTNTPSETPTSIPTNTATWTPSLTPSNSPTPAATASPTLTPTNPPANTPTATYSPTSSPTDTATSTPTATATSTSTNTPTSTAVPPTATNTSTSTPTSSPTDTATWTPTSIPSATQTPTSTSTSTAVPQTPTNTSTNTPTDTLTPTDTATWTPTETPAATNTATSTSTSLPTEIPTMTPTDSPTNTATRTPSNTPTKTPTKTPTATATHAPAVTISPLRTTVNSWINYSLIGYPRHATVTINWRRLSGSLLLIGTVKTDGNGAASGKFQAPATPGGPGQKITFVSGSVSKTLSFEIAPRIKVLTSPAARGQLAEVSLRGYAKNETVRIRWKKGDGWATIGSVVTSNTGSANLFVTVPIWAPNGFNSVRGDGTVFRQQTNVVYVQGGPYQPLTVATTLGTVKRRPVELSPFVGMLALPLIMVMFAMRRSRKRLNI